MLWAKALRKSAPRKEFKAPPTFHLVSSSRSGKESSTEEEELSLLEDSSLDEEASDSSLEERDDPSGLLSDSEIEGVVALFSGEESKRESEEEVFPGATHDPRNKGSVKSR